MKLKIIIINSIISICLMFVYCIQTVDFNHKNDIDNVNFNVKFCDAVSGQNLTKTNNQLKSNIEYEVGTKKSFIEKYVNNDELEFFLVTIGEHCAIWVQYDIWYDNVDEAEYELIKVNTDKIYHK